MKACQTRHGTVENEERCRTQPYTQKTAKGSPLSRGIAKSDANSGPTSNYTESTRKMQSCCHQQYTLRRGGIESALHRLFSLVLSARLESAVAYSSTLSPFPYLLPSGLLSVILSTFSGFLFDPSQSPSTRLAKHAEDDVPAIV